MTELISRLHAPTPVFWKKVQRFGGSLIALGTAMVVIPHAPALVVSIGTHFLWSGPLVIALSQFTVDAPAVPPVASVAPAETAAPSA